MSFNQKSMLRVGITGQNGFIGGHLNNTLKLFPEKFKVINFEKEFFYEKKYLDEFVLKCDVIVHLAALNRHSDLQILHQTNVLLVNKLVQSLVRTQSRPHVIFSSSTQEELDHPYGASKREGRLLFEQWATDHNGAFTAIIIPNIFGPFCLPNYNSVVATFCHKISRKEETFINNDGLVKLLYVGDLVSRMCTFIENAPEYGSFVIENISHTREILVSELHEKIVQFKKTYQDKSIIPSLENDFELNLFNTFRTYIDIQDHFPVNLKEHADDRGMFVEVIKLHVGGQVSFSTTVPNVTRGNHFHTRKIERFIVIQGKALIQLRRIGTNDVINLELDGKKPSFVDMPIWYTHNIKNVGTETLYTIFWINEFYDPENADTYFEVV